LVKILIMAKEKQMDWLFRLTMALKPSLRNILESLTMI
jgi:hypothetical protein